MFLRTLHGHSDILHMSRWKYDSWVSFDLLVSIKILLIIMHWHVQNLVTIWCPWMELYENENFHRNIISETLPSSRTSSIAIFTYSHQTTQENDADVSCLGVIFARVHYHRCPCVFAYIGSRINHWASTHRDRVTHIWVTKLGHHWFR